MDTLREENALVKQWLGGVKEELERGEEGDELRKEMECLLEVRLA